MSQVARVQSGDHTESECHRIVPPRGDIKAEMEVARRREWGECPGQRGGSRRKEVAEKKEGFSKAL